MRNNKLKEIKQFVKTICESNDNYEDIEKCMKQYFTIITDSASPRAEEFNKKYNVITLANSKVWLLIQWRNINGKTLCELYIKHFPKRSWDF